MRISGTREGVEAMRPVTAPAAVRPTRPEPGSFAAVLGSLGRELDRGEALAARASRGGATLDAGALLALQAGIYRYTEAVDLASKLVDRAASAVKTTLQSG